MAGRPTDYTEELGDKICAEVARGTSLSKVCDAKGMPSTQSVYTWFRKHEGFLDNYVRAKEESADADQDRIDEIAEKVLTGEYEPQVAKVAADLIKWSASKKRPKKYGDKVTNEHTGPGGGPMQIQEVRRTIVDPESPDS
jgi:hypothetical protein